MKKRRLRKQFKKFLVNVIGCLTIGIIFYGLVVSNFTPKHGNKEYTYKEITILPGDRMWDIAEMELANNPYYEGEDIRQVIFEIEKDNEIQAGNIKPNQIIKVRVEK